MIAAGVPRAFEHHDYRVGVIGYVIVRLAFASQRIPKGLSHLLLPFSCGATERFIRELCHRRRWTACSDTRAPCIGYKGGSRRVLTAMAMGEQYPRQPRVTEYLLPKAPETFTEHCGSARLPDGSGNVYGTCRAPTREVCLSCP